MDYLIKQKPEDFKVNEIPRKIVLDKGEYLICLLKKKNYTTERAIQAIADALRISRKNIGYAGSKDSKAMTEQNISIYRVQRERVEHMNLKDIELCPLGYSKEPLSLGDLDGNAFEIIVRNITEKPRLLDRIVNFYGEQRFSTNNAEIGKAILKKNFKRAISLILEHSGPEEEEVKKFVETRKDNDYVGALKRIPWKTLNLYIHAYQSKLWNETAKSLIEKAAAGAGKTEYSGAESIGNPLARRASLFRASKHCLPYAPQNQKIQIIGFATELEDNETKPIIENIMKTEGIAFQDFIIRAIPDLSSAGTERELYTEIKSLEIGELDDDELNPGKKKITLKFCLSKGSYATEAIKGLFQKN